MSHWNIGSWHHPIKRIPPRLQVIFWREWKGVRWHRWTGKIGCILFGSLILGWVELRFWRRPSLDMTVKYPGSEGVSHEGAQVQSGLLAAVQGRELKDTFDARKAQAGERE